MTEAAVKVHRDVPLTRAWTYDASFPGPTIEARNGHPILIEWMNALPQRHFLPIDHTLCGAGADKPEVRAIVHVHGGKVPPESDGYPEDWITPGKSLTYLYPNAQDAATLWYHDHAMGIERLNQYAGLMGVYLMRDDHEAALGLPGGAHELPLVLCDRWFGQDGQLRYSASEDPAAPWVSEIFCDAHLVNGKLFPYLDVEPRRYRLRVVNGSNSRFYYLSFDPGVVAHQIGSDQGLLSAPLELATLTLAPAERADVVVDFSDAAGKNVLLKSQSFQLMQFRVGRGRPAREPALPRKLRDIPRPRPEAAVTTRTLALNEYHDAGRHRMLMLLNGKRWHDPVTERPRLGTAEVWNLMNLTEDTHPIHLHLVRFRILDRQAFDADEFKTSGKLVLQGKPIPPTPDEAGWKDTVRAEASMMTRILIQFDGYAGRYVWHCHVLEHAANEMMRPFEVVETPT
ncbi:MAG TPA: multicopper oxidase domain-containing protein [Polyangia bacterium]|nr:multicopper oxidase domain-containing protein [Polyangia bacterium]